LEAVEQETLIVIHLINQVILVVLRVLAQFHQQGEVVAVTMFPQLEIMVVLVDPVEEEECLNIVVLHLVEVVIVLQFPHHKVTLVVTLVTEEEVGLIQELVVAAELWQVELIIVDNLAVMVELVLVL
jgi:hypothetical protein